jgi:hypothetical protein
VRLAAALALGGALAAALAGAGAYAGPRRAPAPGRETTLWLAVESAAHDRDLRFEAADRDRFRARFGREPQGVLAGERRGERILDAPWLWTRLAAAARGLGAGGPYALGGALCGLALGAALALAASRLGGASAALLVAAAALGSPVFLLPFRLESFALEFAAAALAAAAVWHRRLAPVSGPDQVYRGPLDRRPSPLRWALAGLASGVVFAGSPAYLPVALPLLAAAPKERRQLAGGLYVAAAAAALAALAGFGGSPWEPVDPVVDLRLLGWSAAGLLAGRGVGIAPYFAPIVLLFVSSGAGAGRRFTLLAVLGALALQLLLAPFDFVAGTVVPGNGWFLPLFALVLAAVEHAESRGWSLAALVVAAPFLAPHWLGVVGFDAAAREAARRGALVVDLLPAASTLRREEGAADLARPELAVRGFAPAIAAGADDRLRLRERSGTLLAISNRQLASVRIELAGDAPDAIEVRGGTLGDTTFRPSGEVAFDIALPRRARRHPVWWSPDGAWIYELTIRLPEPPAKPLPLDVPFGRGGAPEAGRPAGR